VLELKEVTKRYNGTVAVDRLSLVIEPGGIYGLLGPNGAGKTTTIRMVMGIIEPDEGEIYVLGQPFSESLKDRIGYLPEERGLYRKMKVLEHLVFLGEIKGLDGRTAKERASEWLERLELSDWADKTIEALSKGMQQKIQFIATVIHEPQILILDEPFTGLDPLNAQLIKDIIAEMQEEGRTIVLSTHLMDQVEKLCSRICLINKGKKVLEGELSDIKKEFGKNVVTMYFKGDEGALSDFKGVEEISSYGQELTVKLSDGVEPNEFLKFAIERGRVEKFALGEMSLHDIFIAKVREEGGEVDEEIN